LKFVSAAGSNPSQSLELRARAHIPAQSHAMHKFNILTLLPSSILVPPLLSLLYLLPLNSLVHLYIKLEGKGEEGSLIVGVRCCTCAAAENSDGFAVQKV
jgi:hypothetical protein